MSGKPKPMFYLAVAFVVIALIGFAIYRSDLFAPQGEGKGQAKTIDPGKLGVDPDAAEAGDTTGITTVQEYEFKPSERLPEVKGIAAYQEMTETAHYWK